MPSIKDWKNFKNTRSSDYFPAILFAIMRKLTGNFHRHVSNFTLNQCRGISMPKKNYLSNGILKILLMIRKLKPQIWFLKYEYVDFKTVWKFALLTVKFSIIIFLIGKMSGKNLLIERQMWDCSSFSRENNGNSRIYVPIPILWVHLWRYF